MAQQPCAQAENAAAWRADDSEALSSTLAGA
eukprot:CAMPEP_0175468348 /NCGR_PEP_ID=MMETSP0095-20121207/71782_1 /TAXON_ID=311494 /ORGANISM="Alexandrium monilatum, Strain CCMP3105" /LENGTH=30 /DNA_ID= /DNA_START= /DNA_END= /DNA_ORIENTATION=